MSMLVYYGVQRMFIVYLRPYQVHPVFRSQRYMQMSNCLCHILYYRRLSLGKFGHSWFDNQDIHGLEKNRKIVHSKIIFLKKYFILAWKWSEIKLFPNFSCMFLNTIIFSNFNHNCSNLLDVRNFLEQVKKDSVTFHCLNKLM